MARRLTLGNAARPLCRKTHREYARNMNGLGVLEHGDVLYYNIRMSDHGHAHHHHHHPGHVHPPAGVAPSILRLSALQRLGFAAGLIVLLWAAAFWAMR
jgi:hypothetical protein